MKTQLKRLGHLIAILVIPTNLFAIELNEIRIYQDPGLPYDKYFELAGSPGQSLANVQYIVLEGGGKVLTAFRPTGQLADGYYAATNISEFDVIPGNHVCTGYDEYVVVRNSQPSGLSFPQTGNVTYMVVLVIEGSGQGGAERDMDLDTNDDGTLDVTPWVYILDSVTVIEAIGAGGLIYSPNTVGPTPSGEVPCHVIKCYGEWWIGNPEVCSDDTIGAENCSIPVSIVPSGLDDKFALYEARPNPFNPQTTISFELPRQTNVSLRVFDLSGRLVRFLISGELLTPGRHQIVWNGQDEAGRHVSSGVYLYRLEAEGFAETKRVMVIK